MNLKKKQASEQKKEEIKIRAHIRIMSKYVDIKERKINLNSFSSASFKPGPISGDIEPSICLRD